MKRYMNKGFTSVEVLLSLWIISIAMGLLASVLPMIQRLTQPDDFIQDQIGLRQLRHLLLLSEKVSANQQSLEGFLYNEAFTFIFDRHRLVKTPGYEIFLTNLEAMNFITKEACIYLEYQKVGSSKINQRWLTCQQPGVDFTLFPDADATDDFNNLDDEYTHQDSDAATSK